jgi:hypothetical protein
MSDEINFDFGFTSEDQISAEEKQRTAAQKEKLLGLRKMIMPLLNNLLKSPEMDIIKWEGKARVAQINAFIKKMDDYIDKA